MRHNLHPSYSARSSSVPLSHHNFTDYPVQNNPETVLRISLHPACEDLHTQPLLPNEYFSCLGGKSANCDCGASAIMLATTAGACGSTVSAFLLLLDCC